MGEIERMQKIIDKVIMLLLLTGLFCYARRKPLPEPVPRLAEIPNYEKTLNWEKIPVLPGEFFINRTQKPEFPTQQTEIKMAWNEDNLKVFFRCFEERMNSLITYHTGGAIWQNDCVEFFIDVDLQRTNRLQVICSADAQFVVNTRGLQVNEEKIKCKTEIKEKFWDAEITIPWKSFNLKRPELFRAALSRERRAGETEYTTWNWPSGFNDSKYHAYFFAGEKKIIITKIKAEILKDKEYLQALKKYNQAAYNNWQKWFEDADKILQMNLQAHSPELFKWLDDWHKYQNDYPRNDSIYNNKIIELLQLQ